MDLQPPVETPGKSRAASSDTRFVLAVAVLLVVVIGMLAVLWLRERRERVSAQEKAAAAATQLAGLNAELAGAKKENAALRMLLQQLEPPPMPASPDAPAAVAPFSWSRDRVTGGPDRAVMDKHPMVVLSISAQAGERLGFRPGDLVYVAPAPASQPASGPASAPAPVLPKAP